MADLSDINAAQSVKIVGSDTAGVENTPANITSTGAVHTNLRNNSGSELLGQQVNSNSIPITISSNQSHTDGETITGAEGIGLLGSNGSLFKWLKLDANGSLSVAISPTANTFFTFGDVGTAALTQVPVRRTTYTEQTTNAQRSIASASASDTSAGTGARTVKITYLNDTGAGPFTETVTLNGVTFVNTVNTDICFIEKMEVITAGSTGSNVGILTLKAATAGGGATIGTISATNNQTFWSHHYIPTGKTMRVTGISCSHNGTTVGSGALFILRAIPIPIANQIESQISDFVRLYGQSSTFGRSYNSPIKIVGPARVIQYVTPESSSSFTYRGSFDFFEE